MAFQESQKLSFGIRVLVGVISIPALIVVIRSMILQPSQETTIAFIIMFVTLAATYFLLINSTAHTRIDTQGIHYKYFPFVRNWKVIPWNGIKSVQVKKVSPLTDFGGWGYRWAGKKKGIILSGDQAIIIGLTTGKTFVITTQEPDRAQRELDHHLEAKLE